MPMPLFDRGLGFAEFFVDFGDDITQLRPIEIDPGRFCLRFLRAHWSGQRRGKTFEIMRVGFSLFLTLNRLPLPKNRAAIACIALCEDMWVTAHQLVCYFIKNIVDLELA